MIAGLVVVSVVATGIMSKLSPKLYEAKATLLPAKEQGLSGGGMSFGDKEKGGGGMAMVEAVTGKTGGPSLMDLLHAILNSRVMAEVVVEQLNLTQYYGVESRAKAVRAVQSQTDIKGSRFRTIEITVLSQDPQMAADIANAYASNLDRLNKEFNITATKRNRLFIEARLAEKARILAVAEEALKAFQTEHRTIVIKDQAEAAMDSVADLHAQIVAHEVELASLREYATQSHPMINQLQAEIQELRRQLDRLERDQAVSANAKHKIRPPLSRKTFPFFEEAPSLVLDYMRLSRQVKVEEAVYGMLVGMLEQAKIMEVRDVPTIQVLDPAVPPEHRSRPKTLENIKVAGILSLILGVVLAFFLEYLKRIKYEEQVLFDSMGSSGESIVDVSSSNGGNGNRKEDYPVSPQEIHRFHGGV